ncbi:hypothetical protein KC992_03480 [Candidatus Saccharibacteria bacterium]|nr:hypothetical protein [Candidatus Saccharibacteria bacterium]MCA9328630.1 hypothetical protein [Candidatus Saccharibacteria bacterium]
MILTHTTFENSFSFLIEKRIEPYSKFGDASNVEEKGKLTQKAFRRRQLVLNGRKGWCVA